MRQLAEAARGETQVLLAPTGRANTPPPAVIEREDHVKLAVPVFVSVTVWVVEVVPTACDPKVIKVAERVTAGAAAVVPVPERVIN
jgi:hypothetical protein